MFFVDTGIYALAFIVAVVLLKFATKNTLDKNKSRELNELLRKKENGEPCYFDDLKYLTKKDLQTHLKNVRLV